MVWFRTMRKLGLAETVMLRHPHLSDELQLLTWISVLCDLTLGFIPI